MVEGPERLDLSHGRARIRHPGEAKGVLDSHTFSVGTLDERNNTVSSYDGQKELSIALRASSQGLRIWEHKLTKHLKIVQSSWPTGAYNAEAVSESVGGPRANHCKGGKLERCEERGGVKCCSPASLGA